MDANNFFSLSRIVMVMKREIIENWKTNVYRLIGLYAAFALTLIFAMIKANNEPRWLDNPEWAVEHFCLSRMIAFMIIAGIASFIYAANIMENMKTKEKRISFLMLPATMFEKFIVRFLYVTVGLFVAILLTVSLAEITRLLLLPLFNVPATLHQTVLPKIFSMFIDMICMSGKNSSVIYGSGISNWGLVSACIWTSVIWHHSLFILGGNYWYKKPFLKTLGTLWGIMFLLGFIASIAIGRQDPENTSALLYSGEATWATVKNILTAGVTFFSLFTIFNWWLSYKLFTRSQIIKPKFHLL
ncbi:MULTISPECIES: hypothetical protein [Sanguibacteroides]|uniref:Membrane protein n=1 Tax=Sanguibacteroides justesenii TaxID=1547597 RepID=A0A0C3RF94_9PORP|nr:MULTISPECIES: hypothetical protein [Sanguibacteroides]KIO43849.1 membrane protein [Sanguibacteroides justesenii]KIO46497.1 membrane protein [Sanguibacteroides justesenii]PXZ44032.1 hypothetical protein DMB45_08675 [Sanguibacteroides justesenii]